MKINHENILKNGKYTSLCLEKLDKKTAVSLYRFMLKARRLQEAILKEYHPADEIKCPVHFSIGQEAVPAALSELVRKEDYLFGPHRSHDYYLAKGGSMEKLLAELYGKKTGTNGGKAGSQEISQSDIHFYSGAILSGLLAICVGVGLAFKMKKLPYVAVTDFGDGATDEGIFWEAVSYAQLAKLPVIFVCENNRYSTYSPQLKRQPHDNINERVACFGLKSYAIFGNDAAHVYSILKEAFEYAREGQGPVFVEAYTYRWRGHVGPEDDDHIGYRPAEELRFWKDNCPLAIMETGLLDQGILTSKEKENMEAGIQREISSAFSFAKASPFPDDIDWEDQNYCKNTPKADALLKDIEKTGIFNHDQAETRPEPY